MCILRLAMMFCALVSIGLIVFSSHVNDEDWSIVVGMGGVCLGLMAIFCFTLVLALQNLPITRKRKLALRVVGFSIVLAIILTFLVKGAVAFNLVLCAALLTLIWLMTYLITPKK